MENFLELSCFFDDPVDVGNLISGSSAVSQTSLNIWNFTCHSQKTMNEGLTPAGANARETPRVVGTRCKGGELISLEWMWFKSLKSQRAQKDDLVHILAPRTRRQHIRPSRLLTPAFDSHGSHPEAGKMSSAWWCGSVAKSCPTLFNPVNCSLPGSSVHWILQARILGWVAISFSRGSSPPRN